MGININYKKNGGNINIYINSISGNNYTRCALVCARVRAYPPPFVMCERVRVVSECRPLGVLLPSDGVGLMSAAALGGLWLVRVSRGVLSPSLVSLVCPRWRCGGVCGLVSCFFVVLGSLVGSCQKVACRLNFGLVSVRCRVGVSL